MADVNSTPVDDSLSYAAAVREIEEILARIEKADIDVDSLSQAVERAHTVADVP
jgi:exonuclease VII small subunit